VEWNWSWKKFHSGVGVELEWSCRKFLWRWRKKFRILGTLIVIEKSFVINFDTIKSICDKKKFLSPNPKTLVTAVTVTINKVIQVYVENDNIRS
jgi:hypothetical protein